jgi:predicted nucleic acid-binding protein
VILDVLLKRDPWYRYGAQIWAASEKGDILAYLTANSLTDIHYVARRLTDFDRAREAVCLCLQAYRIASINREVLETAFNLAGIDYEDDVQIACAETENLEGIVTRDTGGFKKASCPVWSPKDFIRLFLAYPGRVKEAPPG